MQKYMQVVMRVNVWVPSELKWRKEETTWGGKKYKFPRKCMPAGVLAIHQYVITAMERADGRIYYSLPTALALLLNLLTHSSDTPQLPVHFFFNPTLLC